MDPLPHPHISSNSDNDETNVVGLDMARRTTRRNEFLIETCLQGTDGTIRATTGDHTDRKCYRSTIYQPTVRDLTQGLCLTSVHLARCVHAALEGAVGWSADVRPSPKVHDALALTVTHSMEFRDIEFVLVLYREMTFTADERIDMLVAAIPARTDDAFSPLPQHCHGRNKVYHKGLAVVCDLDAPDERATTTTGTRYTCGRHYIEFCIIRERDYISVGVTPHSADTPVAERSGDILFACDGNVYGHRDQVMINSGMPFDEGNYVGVLLDMDAGTVAFHVNSHCVGTVNVPGEAYSIGVSLNNQGESVKLAPKHCWHAYAPLAGPVPSVE